VKYIFWNEMKQLVIPCMVFNSEIPVDEVAGGR
jgi:hypothetical protein